MYTMKGEWRRQCTVPWRVKQDVSAPWMKGGTVRPWQGGELTCWIGSLYDVWDGCVGPRCGGWPRSVWLLLPLLLCLCLSRLHQQWRRPSRPLHLHFLHLHVELLHGWLHFYLLPGWFHFYVLRVWLQHLHLLLFRWVDVCWFLPLVVRLIPGPMSGISQGVVGDLREFGLCKMVGVLVILQYFSFVRFLPCPILSLYISVVLNWQTAVHNRTAENCCAEKKRKKKEKREKRIS